jgi:predicted nucleic acid-binding protein
MTGVAYVDSSALAKLLLVEAGSPAMLQWYVEIERAATSRIGIIETRRAVARRVGALDEALIDRAFATVEIVELDRWVAEQAALIRPTLLRTLDAVHLATALQIGPVDAFVTYDDRLADAARAVGLPVVRPA